MGIPITAKNITYYSYTNRPYDSAPGGKYDIRLFVGSITGAQDYINVQLQSQFCFVPTISALNIPSSFPNKLYQNILVSNPVANGTTSFSRIVGAAYNPNPVFWNEIHTQFSTSNNAFLNTELINRVSHTMVNTDPYLLLNQQYNFGVNTINRTRSVTALGSLAVLSVNANTNTGLFPSSDAVPNPGSSFFLSLNGANNCELRTRVTIDAGATFQLGDINGNKGIVEIRDEAAVLIANTGNLVIHEQSTLRIKAGGTLVIRAGGTLVLNGTIIVEDNAYLCFETGAILIPGPNMNFSISPTANVGANPDAGITTSGSCIDPPLPYCAGQTYNSSNNALQFDGVDDFVEVPEINGSLNFGTDNFTFEALIKSDEIGFGSDIQMILSKRNIFLPSGVDGFMWGIWTSGQIFAQLNDVPNIGYDQGPNVLDGNCHYVTLVRQNNVLRFFVDGVQTYSQNISPTKNISSTGSFRIGRNHISGVPFSGVIGEVRVWNAAYLPTTSGLITAPSSTLRGFWDMTNSSSQVLTDLSNRNNDGILGSSTACDANDPHWVRTDQLTCNYQGNFRKADKSLDSDLFTKEAMQVTLYPNPYSEKVDLSIQGYGGIVSIVIRSTNGNIIYTEENHTATELLSFGEKLQPGIYFVEVSGGSYRKNLKLVKANK